MENVVKDLILITDSNIESHKRVTIRISEGYNENEVFRRICIHLMNMNIDVIRHTYFHLN